VFSYFCLFIKRDFTNFSRDVIRPWSWHFFSRCLKSKRSTIWIKRFSYFLIPNYCTTRLVKFLGHSSKVSVRIFMFWGIFFNLAVFRRIISRTWRIQLIFSWIQIEFPKRISRRCKCASSEVICIWGRFMNSVFWRSSFKRFVSSLFFPKLCH